MNLSEQFFPFVQTLKELFSSDYLRKIAYKNHFYERIKQCKPEDFFLLCTLMDKSIGADSLSTLSTTLSKVSKSHLSKQALQEKFNENATAFLREAFLELFKDQHLTTAIPDEIQQLFRSIRIKDSTAFALPGHYPSYPGQSTSSVQFQYDFDLLSGRWLWASIYEGTFSDVKAAQERVESIKPGELILRDIGYFSGQNIKDIDQRGAYYISRIPSHTRLWQLNDEGRLIPVEPLDYADTLGEGESIELSNIRVNTKPQSQFNARVVIHKLTKKQQEQREEHIQKKEQKRKPSNSARKRSQIQILVTNVTQDMVASQDLYKLYGLRWQIEILFKVWKSVFKLDQVRNVQKDRLECHFYGTLICLLISHMATYQIRRILYQKHKLEISEYKTFEFIKEDLELIAYSLYYGGRPLEDILDSIVTLAYKNGQKDRRHGEMTPIEVIQTVCRNSKKVA